MVRGEDLTWRIAAIVNMTQPTNVVIFPNFLIFRSCGEDNLV